MHFGPAACGPVVRGALAKRRSRLAAAGGERQSRSRKRGPVHDGLSPKGLAIEASAPSLRHVHQAAFMETVLK